MQALVDRIPARLRGPIAWLVPVLFALWLHRDGLQTWFFQDDFAWLGLLRQVHNAGDVMRALFDPAAQGTIRPWSERGFFLLFEYLFGVDNLPFRIAVFTTMLANLAMIVWMMRRITATWAAGAIAGIVWMANTALVTVMTWSSAFNEALCPFFLLASLILFIRFIDTGRHLFWWLQVAVFSLGFGVLETNVVYPALALSWVLFMVPAERWRSLVLSLVPLFAISVGYFFLHRALAPIPQTGAYALHFDRGIFRTLGLYAKWSLVPTDAGAVWKSRRLVPIIYTICELGIAAFAIREVIARRRSSLFYLAWFLITLAPVVPLPEHRIEYYLTMPLIGLAMLAGHAFSRWRIPATIAISLYMLGMVPVTLTAERRILTKTDAVRGMVEGVAQARQRHPDKVILLDGIETELYNNAFGHSPFFALGIDDVYLTPDSERRINALPDVLDLRDAVLQPAIALKVIKRDGAVVYSFSGNHLRNITEEYGRSAPSRLMNRLPGYVDPGKTLFASFLGPEWLPAESGFRWMPAQATVRLRGPGLGGGNLTIDGYCPAEQLRQAPKRLWVNVDGISVGETKIGESESSFQRLFPLPPAFWGRDSIQVQLRVNPTLVQGGREHGLVIGRIAVTP